MWHELGILSGVSRTYLVVLVAGMCELSTSVMVYFSHVASVDTCSDVMNSSVCFSSHLSKYTILFVRFRCLELSPFPALVRVGFPVCVPIGVLLCVSVGSSVWLSLSVSAPSGVPVDVAVGLTVNGVFSPAVQGGVLVVGVRVVGKHFVLVIVTVPIPWSLCPFLCMLWWAGAGAPVVPVFFCYHWSWRSLRCLRSSGYFLCVFWCMLLFFLLEFVE